MLSMECVGESPFQKHRFGTESIHFRRGGSGAVQFHWPSINQELLNITKHESFANQNTTGKDYCTLSNIKHQWSMSHGYMSFSRNQRSPRRLIITLPSWSVVDAALRCRPSIARCGERPWGHGLVERTWQGCPLAIMGPRALLMTIYDCITQHLGNHKQLWRKSIGHSQLFFRGFRCFHVAK